MHPNRSSSSLPLMCGEKHRRVRGPARRSVSVCVFLSISLPAHLAQAGGEGGMPGFSTADRGAGQRRVGGLCPQPLTYLGLTAHDSIHLFIPWAGLPGAMGLWSQQQQVCDACVPGLLRSFSLHNGLGGQHSCAQFADEDTEIWSKECPAQGPTAGARRSHLTLYFNTEATFPSELRVLKELGLSLSLHEPSQPPRTSPWPAWVQRWKPVARKRGEAGASAKGPCVPSGAHPPDLPITVLVYVRFPERSLYSCRAFLQTRRSALGDQAFACE